MRKHDQQELRRQESFCDASSWDLLYLKTPKQPDLAGCGVCVLVMFGPMATMGVEALCQLNRQCEDRRADGPLPEGATEGFWGEVQWTTRYINTKETECACRLVNRQETAESGPF